MIIASAWRLWCRYLGLILVYPEKWWKYAHTCIHFFWVDSLPMCGNWGWAKSLNHLFYLCCLTLLASVQVWDILTSLHRFGSKFSSLLVEISHGLILSSILVEEDQINMIHINQLVCLFLLKFWILWRKGGWLS